MQWTVRPGRLCFAVCPVGALEIHVLHVILDSNFVLHRFVLEHVFGIHNTTCIIISRSNVDYFMFDMAHYWVEHYPYKLYLGLHSVNLVCAKTMARLYITYADENECVVVWFNLKGAFFPRDGELR